MMASPRLFASCRRSLAVVSRKAANSSSHEVALHEYRDAGGMIRSASTPSELSAALHLARDENRDRLIVVGGDGSLSCVVNALLAEPNEFSLAIIPAGTGNDFARSLNLPVNDIDAAWSIALGGWPRAVDVVELRGASPGWFLNVVTAGFGGRQAAEAASDQKAALGKIAYWLAAAAQLGEMPEFDVRFNSRGQELSIKCLGFWLANGRYTGGGFPIAPEASVDDGLLDVVVVPSMSALDLIAAGIDLTLLGAEQSDRVWTFRTADLAVTSSHDIPLSIDGDPWNCSGLECHVLRHALRIIAD